MSTALELPPMDQDESEFETLLGLVAELEPERILEIGVYMGGTLARFARRFPLARCVGVDPAPEIDPATFAAELSLDNVALVYGRSQDVSTRGLVGGLVNDLEFDFAFVDGDHSDDAARADWAWTRAVVRPGGIVAFHDLVRRDSGIEVWRLWSELSLDERYRTRVVSFDDLKYGIGVVWLPE